MPHASSRWTPTFHVPVYGVLMSRWKIETPDETPRNVPSGAVALGDGTVAGGSSVDSGAPTKFRAPPMNGGLLFRLVKRFPKMRSWKMPYPARNAVLPVWNGSHESPMRGSKS